MEYRTEGAYVSKSWIQLSKRRSQIFNLEDDALAPGTSSSEIPAPPPPPSFPDSAIDDTTSTGSADCILPPPTLRSKSKTSKLHRTRSRGKRNFRIQKNEINSLVEEDRAKEDGRNSRENVNINSLVRSESMGNISRASTEDSGYIGSAHPTKADQHYIDDVVRNRWTTNTLRKHPELVELRDRLYPLQRTETFSKLFATDDSFDMKLITPLILQHLRTIGLMTTWETLRSECTHEKVGEEFLERYRNLNGSMLVKLLRYNMERSEEVYDYTIFDREFDDIGESDATVNVVSSVQNINFADDELNDVYIWDEPADSDKNVIYEEGETNNDTGQARRIKAASLNKLVLRLTNATRPDLEMMKTFLMTYRSFTTPHRLLEKLSDRYDVPDEDDLDSRTKAEYKTIQLRVMNVIKTWIDVHFYDFDEKLLAKLVDFCERKLNRDGHQMMSKKIMRIIEQKSKESPITDMIYNTITEDTPPPVVPENVFSSSLKLDDIDELEIARQLSLIDHEILCSIKPSELLDLAWTKKHLQSRSVNVRRAIQMFNTLSRWVGTEVLSKEKAKSRGKKYTRIVKIGEHLQTFQNFNSLMALVAGLNNSSIHRLKQTKKTVESKVHDSLEEMNRLISSDSNYQSLREALKKCRLPAVPYLGMFLTDLTFIEEGNKNQINSLINFNKRKQVYSVITEIQHYQKTHYDILPVHQIQKLLTEAYAIDDELMFNLSLAREPRT